MTRVISSARRGKTLLELLVVIVTASAILSVAGQLLFRLSRTERAVRESGSVARAELRLVRDFRADVRRSTDVVAGEADQPPSVRLNRAGGEIVYQATDAGVERRGMKGRDLYRIGPTQCRFHVDADRFAVLEIEPQRSATPFPKSAAGAFRIIAAIGRDASPAASGKSDAPQGVEAKKPSPRPLEAPQPGGEDVR